MFLESFVAYLLVCVFTVVLIGSLVFMYAVHIILGAVVSVILLCALCAWMDTA